VIDELHQFVHEENTVDIPAASGSMTIEKLETSNKNDYPLLALIDPYPVHIDVLVQKSRLDCADVSAQLIYLELAGKIRRHPGNYYSISEGNH
jgi:DNA processing protein